MTGNGTVESRQAGTSGGRVRYSGRRPAASTEAGRGRTDAVLQRPQQRRAPANARRLLESLQQALSAQREAHELDR